MGRAQISYTNKDYESLRRELVARVPQLTDRWTDFNPSDLGVTLLELLCGIGDMLAYYLDAQAAESFLATARRRESVINLCKLIGYRMKGPVAATTTLRFSLDAPLDEPLTIPAGTRCQARIEKDVLDFETVASVTIQPGHTQADAHARQGVSRSESFTSDGKPDQRLTLAGKQIAEGTLRVRVEGADWSEVAHFQASGAGSLHFTAETDHLDIVHIHFGDGRNGAIPADGHVIEVRWLETLGSEGNLGPQLVTQVLTPVYHRGAQVPLRVINPAPAVGGAPRESIERARLQAPAELSTLWKAVTRTDFETLATGFPGIAKARVIDPEDCPHLPYLQVLLAVAPEGGGIASGLLKKELSQFIEQRRVATVQVRLIDPVYRPIDIDAQVFMLPGEDLQVVERRIHTALAQRLAFGNVAFGQDVHVSELVSLIDAVPGVSHLMLIAPATNVRLKSGEVAALGNVYLDMRRVV